MSVKAALEGGKKTKIRPPYRAINILGATRAINQFYGTNYSFEQVAALRDGDNITLRFILDHEAEVSEYIHKKQSKRTPIGKPAPHRRRR
jgi:hypothetical protein